MSGYIKAHRVLAFSDLWLAEKFTRGQAWFDLLMLANYKTGHLRLRGVRVDVPRGHVGYSEASLALRWKWSRPKVRRCLLEWAKDDRIELFSVFSDGSKTIQQKKQQSEQQKSPLTTLIYIVNYDLYQGGEQQNEQQNEQQKNSKRTAKIHEQEVKEVKELRSRTKTLCPTQVSGEVSEDQTAGQEGQEEQIEMFETQPDQEAPPTDLLNEKNGLDHDGEAGKSQDPAELAQETDSWFERFWKTKWLPVARTNDTFDEAGNIITRGHPCGDKAKSLGKWRSLFAGLDRDAARALAKLIASNFDAQADQVRRGNDAGHFVPRWKDCERWLQKKDGPWSSSEYKGITPRAAKSGGLQRNGKAETDWTAFRSQPNP